VSGPLPAALDGTVLRILATSDLGATTVPLRTSYGESGTCAGVVALLERERERQPTIWLDLGDLVVGTPAYPLLGERPWDEVADLPIAAAAVGNHEFDDGVDALLAAVPRLSFALLCANVDVGLPGSTLIDTEGGPIGVIGLTHPASDRFSGAPPIGDWHERVRALARDLRRDGARWVVALLHDGVEWWPSDDGGPPIATRSERLDAVARPWADHVDLILCGHNFGSWVGTLGGTPAAEPHLFAASLSVVDLAPKPVVRGVYQVPPVRPAKPTPATEAIDAAAARVVGELPDRWVTRTGAAHYLPNLIAAGLRSATGADAGFVMPSFHAIQAPIDGVIAALGPGPVTELDVLRPLAALDYDPVVAELRPGELDRVVESFWATADPRNAAADRLWWNWCRMPAGTSVGAPSPQTVAMIPGVVAHVSEWLGRDLDAAPGGVSAPDALIAALS
jgi:2',3'-cyclic-nucleotide 2'-phosphodiesterase (5'-nucleotidase family)